MGVTGYGRVYQTLAQRIVKYCGPGWAPWLAGSSVEVHERAQNRCQRAITVELSNNPVEALRAEAGFSSVATVMETDAAVALKKSLRLPPTNPRYQIAAKQVQQRLKRENWRESASRRRRTTVPTSHYGSLGVGDWIMDMAPTCSEAPQETIRRRVAERTHKLLSSHSAL